MMGGASTARGTDESLRFGFGRNWADFVDQHFTEARVVSSAQHMRQALRVSSFGGMSFLDIGCGSGLHSLAAFRLGATDVMGVDYDANSVATSRKVLESACGGDVRWVVEQASVLDVLRMEALPKFDIVYSWGVLHHTGDIWKAMDNALIPLKPDGVLYLALYSSEQYVEPPTARWIEVKRSYNRRGRLGKSMMEWSYALRQFAGGLRHGEMPWSLTENYGRRGMEFWSNIRDWLGGWPIEFTSYAEVDGWARRRELEIVNVLVGEGCTEFVLANPARNVKWRTEQERRSSLLQALVCPFESAGGLAWVAKLPELTGRGDDVLRPRGSKLMLYYDDRPIGLPHFTHKHVARFGGGRFLHWGDQVVFSTPDGGDPNVDPSKWSVCAEY